MKEVKPNILGRVCILKQIRESLGMTVDSTVCIEQSEGKIIITKGLLDSTMSCMFQNISIRISILSFQWI